MRQRQPRIKNSGHLDYIRGLPCCICLNDIETQAAHLRMADLRAGKPFTGMGQKSDDKYTVPLCGLHHRDQHDNNEEAWWITHGIDAVKLALALWANSGDHEVGESIIRAHH
jgi:hypothetical protein